MIASNPAVSFQQHTVAADYSSQKLLEYGEHAMIMYLHKVLLVNTPKVGCV